MTFAGMRVHADTNSQVESTFLTDLALLYTSQGPIHTLAFPEKMTFGTPLWSFNSCFVVVPAYTVSGVELWLLEVSSCHVRKLTNAIVNATLFGGYRQVERKADNVKMNMNWTPDSEHVLFFRIPNRGPPPSNRIIPTTFHATGNRHRTWSDLSSTEHDEELFEYYCTSQLTQVHIASCEQKNIGEPGLFCAAPSVSPDGRYMLLRRVVRPYYFFERYREFGQKIEILENGVLVQELDPAKNYEWQPHKRHTLVYVDATDTHNLKRLIQLSIGSFIPLTIAEGRRFWWLKQEDDLLVENGDCADEWSLLEGITLHGERVAIQNGQTVYLLSRNKMKLVAWDLSTKTHTPLFKSTDGSHQTFRCFGDPYQQSLVLSHETETIFPELLRVCSSSTVILHREPSHPHANSITKRIVSYPRSDGVQLTSCLYMPVNAASVRLPLLMWIYPNVEHTKVGRRTSIYNDFIAMRGTVVGGLKGGGGAVSVKLLATQGYAVLYMTDMPVIGTNDTYIEQIIDNARSAINELHRTGIIDRKRVAVGGHSYGAFSTYNILAHCDLFVTGIALSGACNRTLDPFGFHEERRDMWAHPELYNKISPLLHAHKITVPVLIFHGMQDDSQSSRVFDSIQMFRALCAHGDASKLILLPHENHRYSARETILHVIAESLLWLHKYVPYQMQSPSEINPPWSSV